MRASREIEERLRAMLTKDKLGVKNGFLTAFNGDLNKLISDYFELISFTEAEVTQSESGEYAIEFKATASRIKSFDSTADLRRE